MAGVFVNSLFISKQSTNILNSLTEPLGYLFSKKREDFTLRNLVHCRDGYITFWILGKVLSPELPNGRVIGNFLYCLLTSSTLALYSYQ